MQARLTVSKGFVVRIQGLVLKDFNIEKVDKSQIGEISLNTLQFIMGTVESFWVPMFRNILNTVPIPLGTIISVLMFGHEWLDFKDGKLEIYDQYFILFLTPKFNIPDPDDEGIDSENESSDYDGLKKFRKKSIFGGNGNDDGVESSSFEISVNDFGMI